MSDQVRVTGPMYRPSRDDQPGIDAGTRRILFGMGAGGLALLVGVSLYALIGHSGPATVPIVQADQGPVRVKPADPGGMVVTPEAKFGDPNDSRLAPASEEPNPRALLALTAPGRPAVPTPAPAVLAPREKPITVQLSAARTEAQAQQDWDRMTKRLPELFAQRRALFQKLNERGAAPWRLRTGGFADAAQAKSFCDKLKAKGVACSLVES